MSLRHRLRQYMKRFLERSIEYKLSVLYAIVGFFFFCFACYIILEQCRTFLASETSFMVETPEQLRAIVFVTMTLCLGGIGITAAVFCWIVMLILHDADLEKRVKRIEKFIEEDPWLSKGWRKDKE